jgi:hypothetical protein
MTPRTCRGPSGLAPPPSEWLADISLPIDEIKAGQVLHRVHRSSFDPIFFDPGRDVPPTNRFDSASGRFGVPYAGRTLRRTLAETLVRNPQRLMVAMTDIVGRIRIRARLSPALAHCAPVWVRSAGCLDGQLGFDRTL